MVGSKMSKARRESASVPRRKMVIAGGYDGHETRAILAAMSSQPTVAADDVPIGAIEDAARRLHGVVRRTPMLDSRTAGRWAAAALGAGLRDGTLLVKAEHLQTTGSFKARGMGNRIATLSDDIGGDWYLAGGTVSGGTIASWTFSMTIQRSFGLRVVFATFFGMADPSDGPTPSVSTLRPSCIMAMVCPTWGPTKKACPRPTLRLDSATTSQSLREPKCFRAA